MNAACSAALEIGPQLAGVLLALIGMIGSAVAGYGYHEMRNGGK